MLPAPVVVGRSRYAAASATPGFSITYSPPPPPLPSPQRISGRTRSKTVWFSATPAVEFPATHEEARSPSPVDRGWGLRHSIGLISMLDKTTLQGMVATNGAVDAVRYKKSGVSGVADYKHLQLAAIRGRRLREGAGDLVCLRDDAGDSGGHRRHRPQCYASDLRVPRSYQEALRTNHAHLWEDSTARDFYGLPDAGTFESIWQPVDKLSTPCGFLTERLMSTVGPPRLKRGSLRRGMTR